MATKVTVNLPDETVNSLKQIAQQRGITVTEALRQAIENEKFFRQEINQGSKVILERPDKSTNLVVLR